MTTTCFLIASYCRIIWQRLVILIYQSTLYKWLSVTHNNCTITLWLMTRLCDCATYNAILPSRWIDLVKTWIADPYFSLYAILRNDRNFRRTLLAKHLATIPTVVLNMTTEEKNLKLIITIILPSLTFIVTILHKTGLSSHHSQS